ncbi:MAG TPA: SRPBCC family protein [Acidimicrobiales bacterium]|jgi:uncharacterized protein YndB with AHSA1/START domain|nr:SRPBCC family protein [Acidimicrobiales bacterium]
MTTPISVSADIAAAPSTVWALVADLTRMGEWSPENEGAEWLRGARGPVVGATFKGSNRLGSKTWTTHGRIVAADTERTLAFRITTMGMKVAEWRYELAATTEGCTVTEAFTDERGPIIKALGRLATGVKDRGSHNRATMQTTLERLKAAAESPRAAR